MLPLNCKCAILLDKWILDQYFLKGNWLGIFCHPPPHQLIAFDDEKYWTNDYKVYEGETMEHVIKERKNASIHLFFLNWSTVNTSFRSLSLSVLLFLNVFEGCVIKLTFLLSHCCHYISPVLGLLKSLIELVALLGIQVRILACRDIKTKWGGPSDETETVLQKLWHDNDPSLYAQSLFNTEEMLIDCLFDVSLRRIDIAVM